MTVKELKILLNQFPDDMPVMSITPRGFGAPTINLSVQNTTRVHEMQGDEGMYIEWYAIEKNGSPTLFITGLVGVGFVNLDEEKSPVHRETGGNSATS